MFNIIPAYFKNFYVNHAPYPAPKLNITWNLRFSLWKTVKIREMLGANNVAFALDDILNKSVISSLHITHKKLVPLIWNTVGLADW